MSQALEEGAGTERGCLSLEQFQALLLRGDAQLELYDVRSATAEPAADAGARMEPSKAPAAGRGTGGCTACCSVS